MSRTRPLHLQVHETSAATAEGVWSPYYRRLTLGLILLTFGPGLEALAAATILPKNVANLGGVIIGVTSAAGSVAGTGIAVVDLFVLAVTGLAILTAVRLPGRPQHSEKLSGRRKEPGR